LTALTDRLYHLLEFECEERLCLRCIGS
jgi:hypothetical protein